MSEHQITLNLIDFDHQLPTISENYHHLQNVMKKTQSQQTKYLRIRMDALLLAGLHESTLNALFSQLLDDTDGIKERLVADMEVMSKFVDFDGTFYSIADEKLQNHHEFRMRTVRQNGMLITDMDLDHFTKSLVMEAVKQDGYALEVMQNCDFDLDNEILRQAVMSNGTAMMHIGYSLTEELQNLGLNEHPFWHEFADYEDQNIYISDRDLANKLILYSGIGYFLGCNFSKGILKEVMKIDPDSQRKLGLITKYSLSKDEIIKLTKTCVKYDGELSDTIHIDDDCPVEALEKLIKYDGNALCLIEDKDQTREMILKAVQTNGESLQYANENLVDDEIIFEAIRNNPEAIKHAKSKNVKSFVLDCAKENGEIICYLKEELRNDRDIVLAAVSNYGMALGYTSAELQDDDEIVMKAITNDGLALEYADFTFKHEYEIILTAVSQNGLALEFAYHQNQKVVKTALEQTMLCFPFIYDQTLITEEMALMVFEKYPHFFTSSNISHLQTRRVTLMAVKGYGHNLKHVAEEFKNDREIVMAAVTNCGLVLGDAPEDMKDDYEIVKAAVLQNPFSISFASDRLKLDWKLLKLAKELRDADLAILDSWEEEFAETLKRCREENEEEYDSENEEEDLAPKSKFKKL